MPQERVPTVDEIVETFRSTDVEERRRLIGRCPSTKFTELALMMAGMTTPGSNVQSLNCLTDSYAFNGPQEFGIAFGAACYKLARELFESPDSNAMDLLCAGGGSISWMTSLSQIGRHAEALARGTEVVEWLEANGDTSNIDGVRLRLVEAAFGLQDYDEAERILNAMDADALNTVVAMSYRSCRDRLEQYKQNATTIPSEQKNDARTRLRRIVGGSGAASEDPSPGHEPEAGIKRLGDLSRGIMDLLGGAAGDNALAVEHRITEAANLFLDPVAGRDAARIAETEKVLLAGRDWMRAHNSPDSESSACWGLYLCYSRTGRDQEALNALQRARANIERARAKIADPNERAGLTARFPQLYPCLVTLLHKLNRPTQVLEAIEASKGRALADALTLGSGAILADTSFSSAVSKLPVFLANVTKEHKTHYITYFVDDDCTYCVLVTPRGGGEIHTRKLGVSRATLDELAREVREAASSGGDVADRIPSDLGERLAPLVELLEFVVKPDDHLCYSPDDALHLLPLQAATFQGRSLVRSASVSRAHGAHFLAELLRSGARPRKGCVVFEVPATQDVANASRLKTFAKSGDWLRTAVKGAQIVAGEAGDFDRLRKTKLKDSLVHFATHGIFPSASMKGKEGNPYRASGLLLASGGKLPDLDEAEQGESGEHLLSPERLVRSKLDFSRSHVTLQACVSGLSREGLGGDALGLEWALFQLGAASILSTHWNVSAQTTGAFASRFYSRLFKEGQSRAAAWRNTVLEFLDRSDALAQPYHWSAFSLSGDWR